MENFSIGILSWHSTDVLINTLTSYHDNGLLSLCSDVKIWFQEITDEDKAIAAHYGVKAIGSKDNVGIGKAFLELAKNASNEKILLLEHDWELIESFEITKHRLESGLKLLDWGYDCVRYRSRKNYGYPHFSDRNYRFNPHQYFDPEIQMPYPHLLDTVHWSEDPDVEYKGKIGKQIINEDIYYVAPSKYANWTNNPCVYNKKFYVDTVKPYTGGGIDLEGKISYWWARQNYNVAHGEGLFKHNDFIKHGTAAK